jgi:hypothetical protein
VANDRLEEAPHRVSRSALEDGDFYEGVVLGESGWNLEVLRIVFNKPQGALVLGDAERLDQDDEPLGGGASSRKPEGPCRFDPN